MKILHVTDCFAPRLGGIERQVADLAQRQHEAGHQVEILTSVAGPAAEGDVLVHRPGRRDAGSGRIHYSTSARGTRLLRGGNYDVVHVHLSLWSPLAALTGRAASRLRVPTAVTVHSMWNRAGTPLQLPASVFRLRQWRAAWSAVSTPAALAMRPALRDTRISVLPNGVDAGFWQVPTRPAEAAVVRIASVMRLSQRKRPAALLAMLAQVRAAVPAEVRLQAAIIGDGPLRKRLQAKAEALGVAGWVDFAGRLSRTEVRDALAATDLYVAPARLESFGIAALEARCAGLPVIGYRDTGIADFVEHDVHGLLVGSDEEMADAISGLVVDRTRRDRIGATNRGETPPATWSQVLDDCARLYDRAAALLKDGSRLLPASETMDVATTR